MKTKGFTLVEIIVAVGLFAVVMTIASGAIFTIVNANYHAQSLNSVISNFNFTIEAMLRDIRTGHAYQCGDSAVLGIPGAPTEANCISGNTAVKFIDSDNNRVLYAFKDPDGTGPLPGFITKTFSRYDKLTASYTDEPESRITAEEVFIDDMIFYVESDPVASGEPRLQPHMLIRIDGHAGGDRNRSDFDIQSYVTQR